MHKHRTAERELRSLVKTMRTQSGREYGLISQVTGEYAGIVRYRHCLTETIDGVIHKRSAWRNTYAALLDHLRTKVQRAA